MCGLASTWLGLRQLFVCFVISTVHVFSICIIFCDQISEFGRLKYPNHFKMSTGWSSVICVLVLNWMCSFVFAVQVQQCSSHTLYFIAYWPNEAYRTIDMTSEMTEYCVYCFLNELGEAKQLTAMHVCTYIGDSFLILLKRFHES